MRRKKGFALRLLSWVHSILILEGVWVLFAGVRHMEGAALFRFLALGAVLFIPVVVTDMLVRRCKSLVLFCLFGTTLVWAMALFAGSRLVGWFTVLICLFRCYAKLKQGEIRRRMREMPGEAGAQEGAQLWEAPTLLDCPKIIHCLLFVLLYLGLVVSGAYGLLGLMLSLLAAELWVCLAYGCLWQLEEFAERNRYVANLPIKGMKRTGAGILAAGTILLLLSMLPAALYHEEPLTKLRFEGQPAEYTGGEEAYAESAEPDLMMEELMRIKASAKETPPWMKAASKLVCLLMLIWISWQALRMVFAAVRRAVENFSDEGGDEVVFLGKDEEDGEAGEGVKTGAKKEGMFSPARRIRRLYRRAVKRRAAGSISGSETPLELEEKAGFYRADARPDKSRDFRVVHDLYEKARYGNEECTKEEVKQCVHIFSNFDR